jgi:hypothetical protein
MRKMNAKYRHKLKLRIRIYRYPVTPLENTLVRLQRLDSLAFGDETGPSYLTSRRFFRGNPIGSNEIFGIKRFSEL